jgi:beta-N-acetylhexosaminidase
MANVGDHFIVGLSGERLNQADKDVLKSLSPAGVLLLGRNFSQSPDWISILKDLIEETRDLTKRQDLLLTLDHEGGRVHRTPSPVTHFPSPRKYKNKAREVAQAMGIELRSLGVNLSWAPLCDVDSNPSNPIIGERAFGTTPDTVTKPALEFMEGLLSEGIIPCAKHFPGHGDTSTDSHLELPVVNKSMTELEELELIPFKALCDAQVPMVMTAHVLFPKIDPNNPATLSPTILKGILRDSWGYEGVIVSDDLEMLAVAERFKQKGTIIEALNAGCDMFITARHNDSNLVLKLADELEASNQTTESALRIQDLIKNYANAYQVEHISKEILDKHSMLNKSLC